MLISSCVLVIIAHANWLRVVRSFNSNEVSISVLRWPIWPFRLCVTVGLVLVLIVCVIKAVSYVRAALSWSPLGINRGSTK
jgi:TRAP-type mannitol/chloroaromatic compound transport system permease small subunit